MTGRPGPAVDFLTAHTIPYARDSPKEGARGFGTAPRCRAQKEEKERTKWKELLWLLEAPVRNDPADAHPSAHKSVLESANPHGLGVCIWMHLVNGTGNSPSLGQPTLEQSNRTSHPGAPLTQPKHVRTHRGSE